MTHLSLRFDEFICFCGGVTCKLLKMLRFWAGLSFAFMENLSFLLRFTVFLRTSGLLCA